MNEWMNECMYVCLFVCGHVCVHVGMPAWMDACMHVSMHLCIYIYTVTPHELPTLVLYRKKRGALKTKHSSEPRAKAMIPHVAVSEYG